MGGKEVGRPHQTLINLGCCLGRVAFLDLFLSLSIALELLFFFCSFQVSQSGRFRACFAAPRALRRVFWPEQPQPYLTSPHLLVLDCYRRPARYFSTAPRFSNSFDVYLRIPLSSRKCISIGWICPTTISGSLELYHRHSFFSRLFYRLVFFRAPFHRQHNNKLPRRANFFFFDND